MVFLNKLLTQKRKKSKEFYTEINYKTTKLISLERESLSSPQRLIVSSVVVDVLVPARAVYTRAARSHWLSAARIELVTLPTGGSPLTVDNLRNLVCGRVSPCSRGWASAGQGCLGWSRGSRRTCQTR